LEKRFNQWNELKQSLNAKDKIMHIKQGEIYFISIGQNIGFETYGKDKLFLRPVLVYKKLSKYSFIGIPLTSKVKEGSYFFNFQYKQEKESTALLSQVRSFDTKRIAYYSGNIKNSDFSKLKEKLIRLIDITPKRGGITSDKQKQRNKTTILTKKSISVNDENIIRLYVASQVIKLMIKKGHKVEGAKILIMGITFKENCPDISRHVKI